MESLGALCILQALCSFSSSIFLSTFWHFLFSLVSFGVDGVKRRNETELINSFVIVIKSLYGRRDWMLCLGISLIFLFPFHVLHFHRWMTIGNSRKVQICTFNYPMLPSKFVNVPYQWMLRTYVKHISQEGSLSFWRRFVIIKI